MPAAVRTSIEEFWSRRAGRGPREWADNARRNGVLPMGAIVRADLGDTPYAITGLLVHAWNNVGRLVLPSGTFAYCSYSDVIGGSVCVTVWHTPSNLRVAADAVVLA